MKRQWTMVTGWLVLLALAGCSNGSGPTRYYLLTEPAVEPADAAGVRLLVGELVLPKYLQSSNMVVASGDSQIQGARTHRWAEPLAQGVRRHLDEALGGGFADTELRLDLNIRRLHGSEQGPVYLDLDWRMYRPGSDQSLDTGRFNESAPQDAPGYEALVRTHRLLLDRFARHIAGVAGGLANQKQPAPMSDAAAMTEKPSS